MTLPLNLIQHSYKFEVVAADVGDDNTPPEGPIKIKLLMPITRPTGFSPQPGASFISVTSIPSTKENRPASVRARWSLICPITNELDKGHAIGHFW